MFDRPRSKRHPVHREGSGVPQNGGNGPLMVETGVLLIGRGVAYRKTDETDLCWSTTVETGVLFIGRGVAYRKTEETDLCWSATLHPPSTSSSLHLRLFIHGLLFIQPPPALLHRLLFNHPSTGTPPSSTVHPALHGVVLFIQPSTPRGPVHPEATPPLTVHPPPPQRSLFIQRGSIHRLQLAAVAKESLDRVQLTAIDRSLGFSNA